MTAENVSSGTKRTTYSEVQKNIYIYKSTSIKQTKKHLSLDFFFFATLRIHKLNLPQMLQIVLMQLSLTETTKTKKQKKQKEILIFSKKLFLQRKTFKIFII